MNIESKGEVFMDKPAHSLIGQWKLYLTNISSNLMELTDGTEYGLIKTRAADKKNGYTGITKERADRCIQSVGVLWQQFALLSEVVEKAAAMQAKGSILYNPEEDIRKLFKETMLVIDRSHVDINERNLIEDETDEKMATPSQLLKHMQEDYGELCRNIKEISMAEESLSSRLANIKSGISRLNSTVKRLGTANTPEFELSRVSEMERDPVWGMLELDKLVYSIEKYRASIKTLEEAYNEIQGNLKRIRSMLDELKELSKKSRDAEKRSRELFGDVNYLMPVVSQEVLKSLEDWLVVLESKLKEGAIKAVGVGASRLEVECSQKLQREREACEFNSKAYNEWLDLKGEFKALLAKAEVLRSRGLLMDNSLNGLIEKINAALHQYPVNMDMCRQLMKKIKLSL